jgi:LPXTG-motif cell wall-anchored protein
MAFDQSSYTLLDTGAPTTGVLTITLNGPTTARPFSVIPVIFDFDFTVLSAVGSPGVSCTDPIGGTSFSGTISSTQAGTCTFTFTVATSHASSATYSPGLFANASGIESARADLIVIEPATFTPTDTPTAVPTTTVTTTPSLADTMAFDQPSYVFPENGDVTVTFTVTINTPNGIPLENLSVYSLMAVTNVELLSITPSGGVTCALPTSFGSGVNGTISATGPGSCTAIVRISLNTSFPPGTVFQVIGYEDDLGTVQSDLVVTALTPTPSETPTTEPTDTATTVPTSTPTATTAPTEVPTSISTATSAPSTATVSPPTATTVPTEISSTVASTQAPIVTGSVSLTLTTADGGDVPDSTQVCVGSVCQTVGASVSSAAVSPTTLTFTNLDPGTYAVTVTNDAPYANAASTVTVTAGETAQITITLEAVAAPTTVVTEPGNATPITSVTIVPTQGSGGGGGVVPTSPPTSGGGGVTPSRPNAATGGTTVKALPNTGSGQGGSSTSLIMLLLAMLAVGTAGTLAWRRRT